MNDRAIVIRKPVAAITSLFLLSSAYFAADYSLLPAAQQVASRGDGDMGIYFLLLIPCVLCSCFIVSGYSRWKTGLPLLVLAVEITLPFIFSLLFEWLPGLFHAS